MFKIYGYSMKSKSATDKELVLSLSKDSEDAFRELYLRYKDKLWHYGFSFLKLEDETDDLIQEIFIRVWELRSFMDPNLSFSSYLYTMTRNRVLNYFRDMDVELQVKKALALTLPVEEQTIESDLIFSEYQQILLHAIDKLPTQRKKIFNLSRTEHLSHKEIANRLGISVYTVQEHISASLRFIKSYFNQYTDLTLSMFILSTLC